MTTAAKKGKGKSDNPAADAVRALAAKIPPDQLQTLIDSKLLDLVFKCKTPDKVDHLRLSILLGVPLALPRTDGTVDSTLSVTLGAFTKDQLITATGCEVTNHIASLPISIENDIGPRNIDSIKFSRSFTYDEADAWLRAKGYRSATPKELLAYGAQHPEEQKTKDLVVLEPFKTALGQDCVMMLSWTGLKRMLGIGLNEYGFRDKTRVLAVTLP